MPSQRNSSEYCLLGPLVGLFIQSYELPLFEGLLTYVHVIIGGHDHQK